jgi:peptidylprolyl isomerase
MCPRKIRKSQMNKSKNKLWLAIGIIAIAIIAFGAYQVLGQNNNQAENPSTTPTPSPTTTPTPSPSTNSTKVLLQTSMGNITIELRNDMPITTGNFINLVQQGKYDGTIFHRVIPNFMIQGGDPTGTGFGDPSIPNIQDEFTSNNKNIRGTIAMANTGQPNSGSSQFFINVIYNSHLDNKHPVFGTVISGMDIVDAISKVSTNQNDKPLQDVTIVRAELIS